MTAPFHRYAAAGYLPYLLPILPANANMAPESAVDPDQIGKVPGALGQDGLWRGMAGWASRQPATMADAQRWSGWPDAGMAIRTGDILAWDIDVLSDEFAGLIEAAIVRIAGPVPVRFGRAPKRLLAYRAAEPLPKWSVRFRLAADGPIQKIEMLGQGQQFVAEGVHPVTGKPYHWRDGRSLASVGLDGLPVLTADQIAQIKLDIVGLVECFGDPMGVREAGTGERKPIGDTSLIGDPGDIERALEAMPNNLDYDAWLAMTAAVKAAFGGSEDGYDVYERWSLQWPGNSPEMCRSKWDSISDAAVGADYVFAAARPYGFTGGISFPPLLPEDEAGAPAKRTAPMPKRLPAGFDPASIPPRQWVLGNRFLAGAVTGGAGAPGVSKSTFSILSALAIVTGRSDLTGEQVHRQGRVWVHNNEDDEDEILRRLAGMCMHYGIDFEAIRDRFLFSSGVTQRLLVAVKQGDQVHATKAVEEIIATIQDEQVVFMACDPFVSTHAGVSENSNEEIERVISCYRIIAARTGCAIDLVHHTVKNHSGDTEARAGDMNAARGAGAFIGAVRVAYTLSAMSEKTADDTGINQDRAAGLVRLDGAKGNYAPKKRAPQWFELISVSIGNDPDDGLADILGSTADTVGVPVRVDLGDLRGVGPASAGVLPPEAEETLRAIVAAVGDAGQVKISDAMPRMCVALGVGKSAVYDRIDAHTGYDGEGRMVDGVEVRVWKEPVRGTSTGFMRVLRPHD